MAVTPEHISDRLTPRRLQQVCGACEQTLAGFLSRATTSQ